LYKGDEVAIKIALISMTMACWTAQGIDVKGAFLKGRILNGENLYLRVPEGFEEKYGDDVVLYLQRTIYGLKQAAFAFWRELLTAFKAMVFLGAPWIRVCISKIQIED